MTGTVAGGLKAAEFIKKKHGKDFYKRIGAKGGATSNAGGFAYKEPCGCKIIKEEHHKAQCAGKIGGRKSKRKGKK